jgi:hypothetical protein
VGLRITNGLDATGRYKRVGTFSYPRLWSIFGSVLALAILFLVILGIVHLWELVEPLIRFHL